MKMSLGQWHYTERKEEEPLVYEEGGQDAIDRREMERNRSADARLYHTRWMKEGRGRRRLGKARGRATAFLGHRHLQ